MAKARKDVEERSCSEQVATSAFDTLEPYIAFVRALRAFGKQRYSMLFDIRPKNMRQLNRQSTFDEKTSYIAAVRTGNT